MLNNPKESIMYALLHSHVVFIKLIEVTISPLGVAAGGGRGIIDKKTVGELSKNRVSILC